MSSIKIFSTSDSGIMSRKVQNRNLLFKKKVKDE